MKKRTILTSLILALSMIFTACTSQAPTNEAPQEKQEVKIAAMKGPTSLGMLQLMDKDEKGETQADYTFTLAGTADEITPKLLQGELDIAAVPANLASTLYNKSEGKIKALAINALGVVYILEKGEPTITSIEDLKGKTICATGKGTTPEASIRYLLNLSGINPDTDVTFDWHQDPAEVVSLLTEGKADIAMLPQPYATVAQTKVEGLNSVLSLNDVWNEKVPESKLVTGTLVVRSDFAENNAELIQTFLEEYKDSTDFSIENIDEVAALSEKYGIINEPIAKKALPLCNITCMYNDEMKTALEGYLQVLYDSNPQMIGGQMPKEDFYYVW